MSRSKDISARYTVPSGATARSVSELPIAPSFAAPTSTLVQVRPSSLLRHRLGVFSPYPVTNNVLSVPRAIIVSRARLPTTSTASSGLSRSGAVVFPRPLHPLSITIEATAAMPIFFKVFPMRIPKNVIRLTLEPKMRKLVDDCKTQYELGHISGDHQPVRTQRRLLHARRRVFGGEFIPELARSSLTRDFLPRVRHLRDIA